MDKWEGKVAVVTGASAGIGKAIAITLAEHGVRVAALARRLDILQEIAEKNGKGLIKAYKCDVSNPSDIEQVFHQICKELGPIRILVNNAGIATSTNILDFSMEKWRAMFDLNVFGMFTCIKHVINSVKTSNDKQLVHIININSIAGHQPSSFPEAHVYSATKHCVTLLTRALLKQLAAEGLNHVKVTSLSPGCVETEIFGVGGWKNMDLNKICHLSSEEVANALIAALSQPETVNISELTIKPAGELF